MSKKFFALQHKLIWTSSSVETRMSILKKPPHKIRQPNSLKSSWKNQQWVFSVGLILIGLHICEHTEISKKTRRTDLHAVWVLHVAFRTSAVKFGSVSLPFACALTIKDDHVIRHVCLVPAPKFLRHVRQLDLSRCLHFAHLWASPGTTCVNDLFYLFKNYR